MYIYIRGGGGGVTIFKSPHPHLLAQPWQGQSWKQAKMTSMFKPNPTWISCMNQSKINATHLSRRNNVLMQPRRPIRTLPAPWVLSTAGKLLIGYNFSVFWDSAVKSVFKKSLSARLRSGGPGHTRPKYTSAVRITSFLSSRGLVNSHAPYEAIG